MAELNLTLTPQDFEAITPEEISALRTPENARETSYGRETFRLLLRNKTAALSIGILLFLILGALVIPLISPFDYATQNVAFSNKPFFSVSPDTGAMHLFGTDHLGRDIFVRIWYGTRISLLVAAAATLIDTVVGVLYGSISGYLGGAADNVMMRILEVIGGIPYLIVVLLLMAVLPQGIGTLILAYSLVGWTGMARLIRGQVRSLCTREYMIAAKIMGASMGRIVVRHLIPNMLGVILVNMTLDIPSIIFTEAFLSMLGMGVPSPYPSLGVLVNEGVSTLQTYPAKLVVPALFLCVTLLALNLLGDKLQDLLQPKTRRAMHGTRTQHS